MPLIAGWLTGEQVPEEVIQQTLLALGEVLGQYGGQPARTVQPGAGLLTHFDPAYAIQQNDEPPLLDWVPERRTLVYRRPLSGAHPLYYIEDWPAQGNLLFASEIKALLAIGAPRRLHLAALDALWRYGFIPAPWTAFEAIRVVPAGSILRWQQAKTVVNASTDFHLNEPLSPTDTLEQFHSLLKETTTHLLPAHDNLTPLVALSGGGPASALVNYLALQQISPPFTLASLGYTKTMQAKAWSGVKGLAANNQQPFLAITGVDQPAFWTATLVALEAPAVSTRPLALHQLLHTVVAETQARSALCGLGAQILCPPKVFETPLLSQQAESILPWYADTLSPYASLQGFPCWTSEIAQVIHNSASWETSLPARKLARHAAQLTKSGQSHYYLDLHLRLPDLFAAPASQLAIQEQLTLRSPFLHADIIDMLTRLPDLQGSAASALLTRLAAETVGERSQIELPLSLPITSLFQETDTELWQQTLSPEALLAGGLFDPDAVAQLLQQRKPKELTIRSLLFVFTTQLFCQMFGLN